MGEEGESTPQSQETANSNAIGDTLYDKEWVEQAVINVVSVLSDGDADLDEEKESDLSSLVDMSVERDVCVFLHTSGCLDLLRDTALLPDDIPNQRAAELTLCLVSNCLNVETVFPSMMCDPRSLQAVLNAFHTSSEAPVLQQAFVSLRTFVAGLSRLIQATAPENAQSLCEGAAEVLKSNLCSSAFVTRLTYVLAASSNEELLENAAKFVFVLFEVNMELDSDNISDSDLVKSEFVSALLEATRQTVENETASFNFVEVLGHLAALEEEERLPESFLGACDVINEYLGTFGEDRALSSSVIAVTAKICHACWKHRRHDDSFNTLNEVMDSLEASKEDETLAAVKVNLTNYLETYRKRYGLCSGGE